MISRHLQNIPIHIMILRHNIRPNILYSHQARIMKVQAPPSCTRGPTGPSFGAGVPVRPQNKVFKFQGGRTFLSQKLFFHHILNHQVSQATLLKGLCPNDSPFGKTFFLYGLELQILDMSFSGPREMCVNILASLAISKRSAKGRDLQQYSQCT